MVNIAQYETLLKKKLGLVQQIYDNTQRQTEAINSEHYEALDPLLVKRQAFMEQVDTINNQLLQQESTKPNTEKILKINQAITQLLSQIEALNKQNIETAKPAKQQMEESFKYIQLGKKAVVNGYLKPLQTQGHKMDKKQ